MQGVLSGGTQQFIESGVTLKQYTKFLILTSEKREKLKKSHLLRETKNKI